MKGRIGADRFGFEDEDDDEYEDEVVLVLAIGYWLFTMCCKRGARVAGERASGEPAL